MIPFDKTTLYETALHVITAAIQRVLRTYPENEDSVSFTLYHSGNKYSESNLEGPVLKQKLRHVKFNVVWSHCRRQPFLNVILVSAPQWLGD